MCLFLYQITEILNMISSCRSKISIWSGNTKY